MKKQEISFSLEIYESLDELTSQDAELLTIARKATAKAYAPYSSFHVGAAARLTNGEIVTGTNQENAAYPAGICAERVMMATASSLYPGVGIKTVAVAYDNKHGKSDRPVSPCGICRQSFGEFQERTGTSTRLLLSGMKGQVHVINNVIDLLPLTFEANDLKK